MHSWCLICSLSSPYLSTPTRHYLTIKFCSTSFTSLPLTFLGITSKIGKERAWGGAVKILDKEIK